MGMFNSIFADLLCPVKQEISKDTEIQIKWQDYRSLSLSAYHLGDTLEDLEEKYDNTWIRTDYICNACSRHTNGHYGAFIKADDQQWHHVFVRIENAIIREILTEAEFAQTGITTFVEYW